MRSVGDSVAGNYSSEAATLMVQKVFRISNNLEERKRLLSGRIEYAWYCFEFSISCYFKMIFWTNFVFRIKLRYFFNVFTEYILKWKRE